MPSPFLDAFSKKGVTARSIALDPCETRQGYGIALQALDRQPAAKHAAVPLFPRPPRAPPTALVSCCPKTALLPSVGAAEDPIVSMLRLGHCAVTLWLSLQPVCALLPRPRGTFPMPDHDRLKDGPGRGSGGKTRWRTLAAVPKTHPDVPKPACLAKPLSSTLVWYAAF